MFASRLLGEKEMSRERVIVEIETLEQALKVEETVRTGYCDPIAENLAVWMAVEEDLSNSYEKLSVNYPQPEIKKALTDLHDESKNNIKELHELLKSIEHFGKMRDRRRELIGKLINSG